MAKGTYGHLAIDSAGDISTQFESFIPSPNIGPTSYKNATPTEQVDKRVGKIWKTIPGRAPTRGKFGSHATSRRRLVWYRRPIPPGMSHIAFKQTGKVTDKGIPVLFQVMEILDPSDRRAILRCVNLLQENVGIIDLRAVNFAEADAIRILSEDIGWEILPEEKHDDAFMRIVRRLGKKKSAETRRVQDRLNFLRSLQPRRVFHSTRGFVGYIVVEFCDSFTVFENLEIDHAMYIAHGPAEEFSRLTRTELRAKQGEGLERFVHSKGWEERLRRRVKLARGDQSPNPDEVV